MVQTKKQVNENQETDKNNIQTGWAVPKAGQMFSSTPDWRSKDGAEEMLEGILAGLFQSQQALMKAQNPQIQEAQETQSR